MRKEAKDILRLSKKILKKDTFNKLKKINNELELEETAKYALISTLEQELDFLENVMKHLKSKSKYTFFIENKLILVPSKIRHFKVEFEEKELHKVMNLLKEARIEIENV